ncbi:MAG: DUF4388 domain-containing protein, partial [Myxococcales bacterium]|nr:DUF4388 domain-containing protein [Myxococcales bacterium]
MRVGSSAPVLVRSLVALARTRTSGVLDVKVPGRSAAVAVVHGAPVAIAIQGEADPSLGDRLVDAGAFDDDAHRRALDLSVPHAPIGEWLVAHGVTTRDALEHALEDQLRERIAKVLAWENANFEFRTGSTDVGVPHLARPMGAGQAVMLGLRALVADVPLDDIFRELGSQVLRLTRVGEEMVIDAELTPTERASVALMRRGVSVPLLLHGEYGTEDVVRLVYALWRTRGAAAPSPGMDTYATILRKQREVRNRVSAHALLDLPKG